VTYADLSEVKDSLQLSESDTQYDAAITRILTSIDTEINNHCHRTFTLAESASARKFPAQTATRVFIDDVSAADGLVVEVGSSGGWTTVDEDDYECNPINGILNGEPWPVTNLVAMGGFSWPSRSLYRVRVTGIWGWPAIPGPVKEAAVLLAVRTLKRPDAPFGVTFGDLGSIQVQLRDPDITTKLDPYQRAGGFG